jgi:hypothetical protein
MMRALSQAFSDLCYIGAAQGGIVGIGEKNHIWQVRS